MVRPRVVIVLGAAIVLFGCTLTGVSMYFVGKYIGYAKVADWSVPHMIETAYEQARLNQADNHVLEAIGYPSLSSDIVRANKLGGAVVRYDIKDIARGPFVFDIHVFVEVHRTAGVYQEIFRVNKQMRITSYASSPVGGQRQ